MTRDERTEARRREWQGGVVPPGKRAQFDREFWMKATPAQRLAAVWEMAEQVWYAQGNRDAPLRLDRALSVRAAFTRALVPPVYPLRRGLIRIGMLSRSSALAVRRLRAQPVNCH